MKYLCMIYGDEKALRAAPRDAVEAVYHECVAHTESLARNGQLIAAQKLQPTATAATVRVRNGKATVTDGPFAETKEQLGGFYMIEARDFNEALRIASAIPPARLGAVEVRPIEEDDT